MGYTTCWVSISFHEESGPHFLPWLFSLAFGTYLSLLWLRVLWWVEGLFVLVIWVEHSRDQE